MTDQQGWIEGLSVPDLRHKLRAALLELSEVEETLASALGYPRSDGGPDDPNGGGYVTGEHTAVSLALEAGSVLGTLPCGVAHAGSCPTYCVTARSVHPDRGGNR